MLNTQLKGKYRTKLKQLFSWYDIYQLVSQDENYSFREKSADLNEEYPVCKESVFPRVAREAHCEAPCPEAPASQSTRDADPVHVLSPYPSF